MRTRYCTHQWTGEVRDHGDPRVAANVSGQHLCNLHPGHGGDCRCVCEATTTRERSTR